MNEGRARETTIDVTYLRSHNHRFQFMALVLYLGGEKTHTSCMTGMVIDN